MNQWQVGDVRNTPGRSMFVRLTGPETGKGAAGKWTDSATGEHGDLLDVIRESCGLIDFKDVADEARSFLALPHPEPEPGKRDWRPASAPAGSPEASRRFFPSRVAEVLPPPGGGLRSWSLLLLHLPSAGCWLWATLLPGTQSRSIA